MKTTLYLLAVCVGLAGCGSKSNDPAATPADPLLGHWQADNWRGIRYDASGKVSLDKIYTQTTSLDVTASTLTFTGVDASGKPTKEVDNYTRLGEQITYTPAGSEKVYARNLTAASFTMEFAGSNYTETFPFHR